MSLPLRVSGPGRALRAFGLLALLLAPLRAQDVLDLSNPVEARIQGLMRAKEWGALADLFETLSPRDRGLRLRTWLLALNRAQRWERLAEVCEQVIPQEDRLEGAKATHARLLRAQALSQLGRHAEAFRAHAENGRLGWPDGHANACAEARLAQDWAGLQSEAEAILAKAPEDPQGLLWKGEALARQEHFTEAEPLLQRGLALDPRQPHGWSNLARCLHERKQWQEGLEACDRALTLDPALLEARFNRGRACFELARYAEARDDFQAALVLQPGNPVLVENLRQAQRYLDASTKAKKNKK